jgi:hypothetical protein
MGFLTFPSMRVTLPLNQMLALVAHGLCDTQAIMMFWNCVYARIFGFLWWLFWGCWLLKVGRMVLVVCNCSLELLSKDCGGACFVMVLFSGLASLLKLVIAIFLNSGLCEYSTYILTLLVSVAKCTYAMF